MAVLINKRRCGNTTRQVDEAIQDLFLHGKVYWADHAQLPENMARSHGFKILLRRLKMEHNLDQKNGLFIEGFYIKLTDGFSIQGK